ncbi:MAG: hypothetical protein S4CHLAM7_05540 [Chlamydiae bacterium]|nr:hypothetical protein [Chlamydiota bacterium]
MKIDSFSQKKDLFIFPLIASLFWVSSLSLLKFLTLKTAFIPLLFFWFALRLIINGFKIYQKPLSSLRTPLLSLHIRLGFISCALYACLLGALSAIPLMTANAIYLTFPLFIPWILRLWIGKKSPPYWILFILIALVGTFASFNQKFGLSNLGVFLALCSALLQGLRQLGQKRLLASEPPFRIWFYQSLTPLLLSSILLVDSWKPIKIPFLILTALAALFYEGSSQLMKYKKRSLSIQGPLFTTSIFTALLADLLIFGSPPPFIPILCALLIYFSLFIAFFQKNILPNPLFEL